MCGSNVEIIDKKLNNGLTAFYFFDKDGFICVQIGSIQYYPPFEDTVLDRELLTKLQEIEKEMAYGLHKIR